MEASIFTQLAILKTGGKIHEVQQFAYILQRTVFTHLCNLSNLPGPRILERSRT